MIAALFFNSNHESVSGTYGHKIEELVFGAQALQNSGERVVIFGGDVFVHGYQENPYVIAQEVFGCPRLKNGKLNHGHLLTDSVYEAAFAQSAFAIVIHGVTRKTVDALERKLSRSRAFLGWKELDWDHEAHFVILGQYLQQRYLVEGTSIWVPGGQWEDEPDLPDHRVETLREWGFDDVGVVAAPLLSQMDQGTVDGDEQ